MIRKAERDDLDAIVAINDAVQPSPWSREGLASELDQPQFVGFVSQDESGRINGYILGREHCDGGDLMAVGVAKGAQRKGLGRKLIEEFVRSVKLHSPQGEIFLEVSHRNHAAIELYKNFGFLTFLIRRNYYPDQSDALCMKLALAKA